MSKSKFERTKPHVNVGRSATWITARHADGGDDARAGEEVRREAKNSTNRCGAGGKARGSRSTRRTWNT